MQFNRFAPYYLLVCLNLWLCVQGGAKDEEILDDDDFGTAGMYHAPAWTVGGKDIRYTSQEEEIFYFFEDHDEDDNMKIDGLELLKAMYHAEIEEIENMDVDADSKENTHRHTAKWRIPRMSALVDKSLKYDLNDDGYLDWPEFKVAAQRLHLVKD
ncbi:hypothetical protein CAPTEDRAFT_188395 [Capitella teleta]|uniref:EF-hand domain-containing protein n=1 Tax=Capitella teleta TaxID=283909 RepID=R7TSJ2_CAPTE|nr:hypothetical protein CAPTEDRAFT_188395 [Capitella teleta]|eukprot:ELT96577.1 hypothetical protein CAPTEDRAFT_188395 [Capitella teleta]